METSSEAYATLNPTELDNFKNQLRQPGESGVMGRLDASNAPVHISAQQESVEILPGKRTNVWTYRAERDGKTYVNPTFRVRKGNEFSAEFTNDLDEETTVHWHGLHVDWQMDGHPFRPVAPGPPTTTPSLCRTAPAPTGTILTLTGAPHARPTPGWPASCS